MLPEPVWIDVEAASAEIERAVQTLEQGDPRSAWALAQVPLNIASRRLLPGAQASWLEPRRRELDEIRLQALEVIGRAGLALGGTQLGSVERAARGLIESEPYRESGYVLLMESLAAQGNVAEGVRTFERLRTLLRDELGTTPSPEALAAHERLLNPRSRRAAAQRDGGGRAGAAPARRASGPRRGPAGRTPLRARPARPALEQRERERRGRRSRRRARPRAAGGSCCWPATRASARRDSRPSWRARAHDVGAVVLTGRASEETLAPYQPFLEALRHFFLNAPLRLLRSTSREYGSELARLVPELRRRAPDLPPPVAGEPESERYRLFEAVVGLLTAIADHAPILLALDDLQWADRPTLLLLRHLARAPDPDRLLILVAYRQTEREPSGFAGTLTDLRREGLVTEIELGGLDEAETAELVRLRTGEAPSPELADALQYETEGNPLFIEEIVRHLTEAGVQIAGAGAVELQRVGLPEGVKQVIARRLAQLGPRTVDWLRVAAVIGRDFEAPLLEQVVGQGEDEFLDALDEALAAGLVVEASAERRRYSFSHALIRETLYEGMSAARRAATHRRVGEALERSRRESLPSLALHFTRAAGPQDAEKAVTYAARAGDQATAMLAHEEAAEHYTRALEVLERFDPDELERRCDLLLLVGEARVRSGERRLADDALHGAARLAEQLSDGERLARAAIGLCARVRAGAGGGRRGADRDARARARAHRRRADGDPREAALAPVRGDLLLALAATGCRRAATRRRRSPRSWAIPRLGRMPARPVAGRCGIPPTWPTGCPARRGCSRWPARWGASSSSSRRTRGWWSTCSNGATATPSTPRSRRSPPARSGCASRSTCGTRSSGARCGPCSPGGSSWPSGWPPTRSRPAPPPSR